MIKIPFSLQKHTAVRRSTATFTSQVTHRTTTQTTSLSLSLPISMNLSYKRVLKSEVINFVIMSLPGLTKPTVKPNAPFHISWYAELSRWGVVDLEIRRPSCLTVCRALSLVTSSGGSRDSEVGIATGYGLDDRGVGVPSPGRVKNFLFSTSSRSALGLTQLSTQWVPGALSEGLKRPRREADHSPTSAEVKNGTVIPPLLHTSSLIKHRENFIHPHLVFQVVPFLRFSD
jgi:hypothetical protein